MESFTFSPSFVVEYVDIYKDIKTHFGDHKFSVPDPQTARAVGGYIA